MLLCAFRYEGFWQRTDYKDKQRLEDMVVRGEMPWKFEAAATGLMLLKNSKQWRICPCF